MPQAIDLSIIIVSFGTKDVTLACLKSIFDFTSDINFEVIVVDNGSPDDSPVAISKFAQGKKNLTLIESKVNLGFGGANNLGAASARGRHILFLNSDTLLVGNDLPYYVHWLDNNPKTGALSAMLTNKDGSLQPSGGYFPNLFRVFAWQFFLDDLPLLSNLISSIHPKPGRYDKNINLDWVTGAFMMIPRTVFEKVGGFDEKIFMYTEEMELCYRIKKLGLQIAYSPDRKIVHLGGTSGGSHLALTLEVKYMLYFWEKHKSLWQLPLVKAIFWTGSLLRYLIFGIIGGNEKTRKTYGKLLRPAS